DIAINDLYNFTLPNHELWCADWPTNVHYNTTGRIAQGNEVAAQIEAVYPIATPLSMTFDATADSYVDEINNTANYGVGTNTLLQLRTADGLNKARQAYIKFTLTDLPQNRLYATLRLHIANNLYQTLTAYAVADNTWAESGITWNNRPPMGGALATNPGNAAGTWVDFDVTSHITANGTYSLGIVRANNDSQRAVSSRESGNAPHIVIQYLAGQPDIYGDGYINNVDFTVIAANWQDNSCSYPEWCNAADLNRSGTVDIYDLKTFAQRWLE
ncbi:MAG: DNRLRE domain-containing protein, partial [Planctomycetes bacterium]|nr:DNRLRE domain-containing protein [Planctomycetota bacterium]